MRKRMTDHFEKAKDKILKEARANGGVTTDHLLDALIATNEDLDLKLEQSRRDALELHKEATALHLDLCARTVKLEAAVQDSQDNCRERIEKLIAAEHDARHTEHMASHHGPPQSGISPLGRDYSDPSDAQFLEHREAAHPPEDEEMGDLRRFWRVTKWGFIVLGGGILIILADQLGNLIFGGPT
jgi:hypothetical protein